MIREASAPSGDTQGQLGSPSARASRVPRLPPAARGLKMVEDGRAAAVLSQDGSVLTRVVLPVIAASPKPERPRPETFNPAASKSSAPLPPPLPQVAAEPEPVKKAALAKARDDLKKLADNLGRLRTDFLTAIANEAPTAGIIIQITDQIGEINDKILSVYSL